ncbi:MAG TPA: hypothetical protein VGF86_13195 [Candidatus Tumulicola sp.]
MIRSGSFAARGAVAALLALAAATGYSSAAEPNRDALLARWNRANPHAAQRAAADSRAYPTPPAGLRALAVRELAKGYRLAAPKGPLPQAGRPWWRQLWTWLSDRWAQIWRAAFGNARLGRRGAVAIGDLLLAAAIGLVLFAAWRLLRGFAFERSRAASLESLAPVPDARAVYARACDRARQGDYAAASRLLFAATVAVLTLRGVVVEDRSATVGDLRRALRRQYRALVPPFDAVSGAFVTSAYAEEPIDAGQWEGARLGYVALDEAQAP